MAAGRTGTDDDEIVGAFISRRFTHMLVYAATPVASFSEAVSRRQSGVIASVMSL